MGYKDFCIYAIALIYISTIYINTFLVQATVEGNGFCKNGLTFQKIITNYRKVFTKVELDYL